jgi:hypothetical protein
LFCDFYVTFFADAVIYLRLKGIIKLRRGSAGGIYTFSPRKRLLKLTARTGRPSMKALKTKPQQKTGGGTGKSEHRYIHFDNMDALACGAQFQLDKKTSFPRRVTDGTVEAARALGLPDAIVESWAAMRLNRLAQETQRLREIKALIDRIYRNDPAGAIKAQPR